MGMLEVAFHCDREVIVYALTKDDGNVLHQHADLMQRVGPGDVRVTWDLAEIDAHKGHPIDRVWIVGAEAGVEYTITGVTFRMVDEFEGDGDLRGTLRRIQSAASKPAGQLRLVSPDGTRWRLTVGGRRRPGRGRRHARRHERRHPRQQPDGQRDRGMVVRHGSERPRDRLGMAHRPAPQGPQPCRNVPLLGRRGPGAATP